MNEGPSSVRRKPPLAMVYNDWLRRSPRVPKGRIATIPRSILMVEWYQIQMYISSIKFSPANTIVIHLTAFCFVLGSRHTSTATRMSVRRRLPKWTLVILLVVLQMDWAKSNMEDVYCSTQQMRRLQDSGENILPHVQDYIDAEYARLRQMGRYELTHWPLGDFNDILDE